MAANEIEDPPLKETLVALNPGEDGELLAKLRTRGFLQEIDVRQETAVRSNGPSERNGRAELTQLRGRLRAHLVTEGLPTDEWPVMPIELDWGYVPDEHGIVKDDDIWIDYVEECTEPLTLTRNSANLLHAINRLLLSGLSDQQLTDAYRAMEVFHLYATTGNINDLAITGEKARLTRAKGPQARKEKASRERAMIFELAKEFWKRHPTLAGKPVHAAKKIFDEVNRRRRAEDPSCADLSEKTIADRIREARRALK
jgi:hypothetical protein